MKEQLWIAEAPSCPFFAKFICAKYVAVQIGEGRSVLLPAASIQLMQVQRLAVPEKKSNYPAVSGAVFLITHVK